MPGPELYLMGSVAASRYDITTIARDVVDYLGEEMPDEDDDPAPLGDLSMYAASGLRAMELEAIATDYDEDSDVLLGRIAAKLKVAAEFEGAVEAFDD